MLLQKDMIRLLIGKPIIDGKDVFVIVQNVGYLIFLTNSFRSTLNPQTVCTFHIYTHIREENFDLYAFPDSKELSTFKLLLSVSGIGPKTALALMELGSYQIEQAVIKADASIFMSVPKVGRKNAQKIIIELKTKIGSIADLDLSGADESEYEAVMQTLSIMGFTRKEAVEAYKKLPKKEMPLEEKVKYCLKELGR
jgi:Holliday junction DNA helicase RuvA